MKILYSTGKPPNNLYNRCREAFGSMVEWDKGVIFTYGDTIYSKFSLTEDLKVHEETHVKQQTDIGRDIWWDRYFLEKDFRMSQEIEAYKNQIVYMKKHYNRHTRKATQKHIYLSMSKLYGFDITEKEAEKLLK